MNPAGLTIQVLPVADSDAEELANLAGRLSAELRGVDAVTVAPLDGTVPPAGAKGLGQLVGWLVVQFGASDGLQTVQTVLTAVRGFVQRTGHSVEITIDGDAIKVSHATSHQQQQLIDTWLARHAPGD